MISSKQAYQIVLDNTIDLGMEQIDIKEAKNRVLRESIIADRDFPPFDRVAMDGIAINYQSFLAGHKKFKIENVQGAGQPQMTLINNDACIEIMTGASLPQNTTTVIRYEDTERIGDSIEVKVDISDQKNIHFQGSDLVKGTRLIAPGKLIGSAEIATMASVGNKTIAVSKMPKIALISTGDELVDVGETPLPHQIRRSNTYTLRNELLQWNIDPNLFHIMDNAEEIEKSLEGIIETHDVICLSGGVSKGKYDHIPEVLKKLGFKKLFHFVRQRPGKPFWLGRKENKLVFAFPGNPVSTFACYKKYFESWLRKTISLDAENSISVRLLNDIYFKPDLTYFAQGKLHIKLGQILAEEVKGNGSGDLTNLLHVDGFIELPEGKNNYKADELYSFIPFRSINNL